MLVLGVFCGLFRSLATVKDFAYKLRAFNSSFGMTPLHITTLAQLELIFNAGAQIFSDAVELLGLTECIQESKKDAILLCFLTPIANADVCKIGANTCSEAMVEALGGQGYMEEIGISRPLSNFQVSTISLGRCSRVA
ncbi:hypothetical protein MAM1_0714d11143 [Mucor ambiguus]|uniref:Uncharacterized protein n=1 Tax=Mucor ambiguus TaxID=91626 RepID=A0A0C9N685_9FUNG|nr:hypothetical protein MAM1_0714d11143 [Mucor ambiguus]